MQIDIGRRNRISAYRLAGWEILRQERAHVSLVGRPVSLDARHAECVVAIEQTVPLPHAAD